jgi:glycosyltransferase involved in cell wall biosynthesis
VRVVINTCDFQWAGGLDLIYLIAMSLIKQQRFPLKLYVLVHDEKLLKKNSVFDRIKNKFNLEKAEINGIDYNTEVGKFNYYSYVHEIFSKEQVTFIYCNKNYEYSINHALNQVNADILLPVLYSKHYQNISFDKVGYIFDFVYRHKPELYSSEFCFDTDINFAYNLKICKKIIVNAKTVKKDINNFFSYNENQILTMPFTPYVSPQLLDQIENDKVQVHKQYNICSNYFMVSNQFWPHKSHEIALLAFKKLLIKYNKPDLNLVFTGAFEDLDGTNIMLKKVKELINDFNLNERINLLGHIPRLDLFRLMRNSIAVIQPTTFEGGPGGGSVASALALDVPCIVSDIEVNLEIGNNPLVKYFSVSNVDDLAEKMFSMINQPSLGKGNINMLKVKNNDSIIRMGEYLISNLI